VDWRLRTNFLGDEMPEELSGESPELKPEEKPGVEPEREREEKAEEKPTETSRIGIHDFAKVQMRVGQVLDAEKIEGSRKLLKLRVDIGDEVRQVVAGISEAYAPEDLLNKKVILVANLKPVKLMGVESNGMIVAASDGGKPVLATFTEDVPNGSPLQ
jgi:methionyl-tRNA synthetase